MFSIFVSPSVLCINTDLSFKSAMLSCEQFRHGLLWNLRVRTTTQMFIIKHKSSFTDLKLLALEVRRLLKHPQDWSIISSLSQCSIYKNIYVAVEKGSANRIAGGLLAAPRGQQDPRGPKGAGFGLEDLPRWQLPPLLAQQQTGATATPDFSARLWATPCFGLKSRLCKNGFLLAPPLQARSSVLTDPAGCAVARPHTHGSSDTSWIWCTCWEGLYPACAKPQSHRRGKR